MSNHAKPWSANDDRIAAEMRTAGKTFAQIGRALNRSASSVHSHLETSTPSSSTGTRKTRPCLCCRTPFNSAGPHNRLCLTCRRIDVSPYHIC